MTGQGRYPGDATNLTRGDRLLDTAITATAGRHIHEHTPLEDAVTDLLRVATTMPPAGAKQRDFEDFYIPRLRLDLIAHAAGHHLARARHEQMAEYRAHGQAAYDLLAATLHYAGGTGAGLQQIIDDAAEWVGANLSEPFHSGIGNPGSSR